jgi:hypothetical protein
MQHVEVINRYTDSLEEITTDIEKKVITVNGKNRPVKDFIDISEERT